MSLHAPEIARIVAAMQQELIGATVREALSDARPGRLSLVVRAPGKNIRLHLCMEARFCRLAVAYGRPRNAPAPHPFVMLLRKHLVGKRLTAVDAVDGDRVVRARFEDPDEAYLWVCELTGRHANTFLLDANGVIVGSFFPNRSTRRNLTPGAPYEPPAPRPAVAVDRFSNLAGDALWAAIDERYTQQEREHAAETVRQTRLKAIAKQRKKTQKLHAALERDLENARKGALLGRYGQVLKGVLPELKKGMSQYEGYDYDGAPMTIPLQPALSPVENMNRLFDKSRRLGRAVGPIEQRLSRVAAELAELKRQQEAVDAASPDSLLSGENAADKSTKKPAAPSRKKSETGRRPYREFTVFGDRPARVGRSARDNDELTLRHARPDDLWLHARGVPGSHVVVPMGRKETPPPELLVDAAHLAAHFSTLRGSDDVEVLYTRRRYIQKKKGSAPGSVNLLKEKSITLRVEKERLTRLLRDTDQYG